MTELDPQRAETALSWQEKIKAIIAGKALRDCQWLPGETVDEGKEAK
jgi:hypothetical protein